MLLLILSIKTRRKKQAFSLVGARWGVSVNVFICQVYASCHFLSFPQVRELMAMDCDTWRVIT